MAERWHARLTRLLQHELIGRQPLILYAAHHTFSKRISSAEIGEGTGGVTEGTRRRVFCRCGGLAETDHVLGHELVHAFQYDMTSVTDRRGRSIRLRAAGAAAVVHRGHGGVSVPGPDRLEHRDVGARRRFA
jgi:hypothetical protein